MTVIKVDECNRDYGLHGRRQSFVGCHSKIYTGNLFLTLSITWPVTARSSAHCICTWILRVGIAQR